MIEAKRVPYGVSDFLRVIRENQYYVDKTMYIPLLEAQPDNLIFIRPRRFGKSLFLSMLEAYYDRWKRTREESDKRYEVVKGKVVPRE